MKKLVTILCATALTFTSCSMNGSKSSNESESENVESVDDYNGDMVYVTPYGDRYHRENCFTIRGHDVSVMSRAEAENAGRTPCKKCKP